MTNYLKRIVRRITLGALTPLEYALESKYYSDWAQTVWIIGPPRSGTTLLYNFLVKHYSFAYMSNFTARFSEIPLIAKLISSKINQENEHKHTNNFNFGRTKGPTGPHEAEKIWYRWFPAGENIYVPPNDWENKSLKEFKRVISSFCNQQHAPGIFKNTYNSMRIAPILEAFPNALFLVCERDPMDIAQSILKARMKFNHSKEEWWALPPKEFDEIKNHTYWEQVVEQVYYIYKQIKSDREQFSSENFYSVSYENLCLNTHNELNKIKDFFAERNLNIGSETKEISTEGIIFSTGKKINEKDYQRIQTKVKELWNNGTK